MCPLFPQTTYLNSNTPVSLRQVSGIQHEKPWRRYSRQYPPIAPYQLSRLLRHKSWSALSRTICCWWVCAGFPSCRLHLTCDSSQEDLFHRVHGNWSKTDEPVISWTLLSALLIDRADINPVVHLSLQSTRYFHSPRKSLNLHNFSQRFPQVLKC